MNIAIFCLHKKLNFPLNAQLNMQTQTQQTQSVSCIVEMCITHANTNTAETQTHANTGDYKCKHKHSRYLLWSKNVIPPNGIKVDSDIPSSANTGKLLACLSL